MKCKSVNEFLSTISDELYQICWHSLNSFNIWMIGIPFALKGGSQVHWRLAVMPLHHIQVSKVQVKGALPIFRQGSFLWSLSSLKTLFDFGRERLVSLACIHVQACLLFLLLPVFQLGGYQLKNGLQVCAALKIPFSSPQDLLFKPSWPFARPHFSFFLAFKTL